ncbi:MAG: hypothetical protein V3S98_06185 [Dehalococcoidia bacterium]
MRAHHRAVTITNRDLDKQLVGMQSVLGAFLGRKVGLQVCLDYLLQNFNRTNELGASLDFDDFVPRIESRKPR